MKKETQTIQTQVLVIGSGIAGASSAIWLAENGAKVVLVTRAKEPKDTNTKLAQGGIISRGPDDTKELLVKDVLKAGDGLCNQKAVEILAEQGPKLVNEFLIKKVGVEFTKEKNGKLHYTKEAAHSKKRIVHFADQTGESIEVKLIKKAKSLKNITILTEHTLIDLLTIPHHALDPLEIYNENICVGAYVLDSKNKKVKSILAQKTVLATGGVGQIYWRTTNSEGTRGDGLVAAIRAGAKVINSEYVQFHPTSLFHKDVKNFLISEAVRGEGGRLKNKKGQEFMYKYDKRGSLAPRDIVSRGIYDEMINTKEDHVYLDIASYMPAEEIKKHFTQIYETCLKYGINITKESIPVAPTAHYFCGGVQVDEWGKTNIKNLYGAGEVSCTGIHGANRLASTSLLEGLVWGVRSAQDMLLSLDKNREIKQQKIRAWQYPQKEEAPDQALISADWQTIKLIMWNYVGIVRTKKRLQRAVADLDYLRHRIEQFYREVSLTDEIIGLRSGVITALFVARSALVNSESKGCHYVK